MYPGTYAEFLWHKDHRSDAQPDRSAREAERDTRERPGRAPRAARDNGAGAATHVVPPARPTRDERKRADAEVRRRPAEQRQSAIDKLETQIAACEASIREIEQTMAAPGFYDDREATQPVIDRHQALMWEVGELMHRWEELQGAKAEA